jgi:hypothetical protein
MRKTIIASDGYALIAPVEIENNWLDLATLARVELTSEDDAYPIEDALRDTPEAQDTGQRGGWKAAAPGAQTIRLQFDVPLTIKRVMLHFCERKWDRMQEFSLRATTADGHTHELVRQQWSFSPGGSTEERENYLINLSDVAELSLWIDPDRGMNRYPATLQALRIED